MKLAALTRDNSPFIAVIVDGRAIPFSALLPDAPVDWPGVIAQLMNAEVRAQVVEAFNAAQEKLDIAALQYALPVAATSKILCAGLNYTDHAKETNQALPEHPVFFSRYLSSFVPHDAPVILPRNSRHFDYECELTAVVGKRLRHASPEEALAGIFGYTVAMDGSIRDYQKRHGQWTMGKNFDASGSIGPWVVTADSLPEHARGLRVQTLVNGEILQDGNTGDMIFPPAVLLSTLSQAMTLEPGDMVLTGTPAGVGFVRKPAVYLQAGDVVESAVESVGVLRNAVVAESSRK